MPAAALGPADQWWERHAAVTERGCGAYRKVRQLSAFGDGNRNDTGWGRGAGRMGGRSVAAGARQGVAGEVHLAGHGRQPAAATERSSCGLVDVYARLSFRLSIVAQTVTQWIAVAGADAGAGTSPAVSRL